MLSSEKTVKIKITKQYILLSIFFLYFTYKQLKMYVCVNICSLVFKVQAYMYTTQHVEERILHPKSGHTMSGITQEVVSQPGSNLFTTCTRKVPTLKLLYHIQPQRKDHSLQSMFPTDDFQANYNSHKVAKPSFPSHTT